MAQRINKDNYEEKVLKSPLPVLIFIRTVVFRASSYHRCLGISRTNAKTHFLYIK